jgi:drug/metabolite transporter (DMT)-like permease
VKNKRILFSTLLMAVAAVWGGAFVAMKETLTRLDVISFLGWRFLIATFLLIIFRPRFFTKLSRTDFLKGICAGAFLGSGYIAQNVGLTLTTVSKTGFITGLYIVFTPLISAPILKFKVSRIQWFSVAVATVGLALLSLNGISMGFGESMVLFSALLFAIHIVSLGAWAHSIDVYALTVVQLGTCAVLMFITSGFTGLQTPPDRGVWEAIIFTALFATAFAFIVQTLTQSLMPAITVAVILAMEVPFAAIFGVIILSDPLTLRISLGGILMIAAMYLIILTDKAPASKDPLTVAGSIHD